MSEILTPDQYMARAAEHELSYARQQIEDMHREVKRLKAAAGRIIEQCDWLLTGDASQMSEEPSDV